MVITILKSTKLLEVNHSLLLVGRLLLRQILINKWTELYTLIHVHSKVPLSTSLTPAGAGNNSYNVIAGKVPEIQAEGSVANDPTAPNGKVYSDLKGYTSFSNNYSIPTAIKPSTDVNYYFEKMGDSESASQSQSFSNSASELK